MNDKIKIDCVDFMKKISGANFRNPGELSKASGVSYHFCAKVFHKKNVILTGDQVRGLIKAITKGNEHVQINPLTYDQCYKHLMTSNSKT